MRSRILAPAAAGTLVLAGSTLLTTPAHAAADAQLSVFHGVPGLTVDVYVNGKRTLNDFKPGMMAGPLELAAGTYMVAITKGDAKDGSNPAIGPVKLRLAAGGSCTAVAHLKQNGDPTATLFTNDVSKTAAGQGGLTVRHVAAAPAVDVRAGGKAVVSDLANLDDGNLDLAVQTTSGLHSGPGGVNAGEVGLAADRSPVPLVAGGVLLLGAVALLGRRRLAAARAA